MKRYVLGFAFDAQRQNVVLIQKNGNSVPEHRGRLNGVGGKIDPDESPLTAMAREFMEETGIDLPLHMWVREGVFYADDWEVLVFSTVTDEARKAKTVEDEKIFHVPTYDLHRYDTCPHVPLLVSLCLNQRLKGFSFQDRGGTPTPPPPTPALPS